MKISKETAEILGLSQAELSIIDSLESKDSKERSVSIVNISKETGIPRTSLYYMLPKLEKRGFIEIKRNNKKIFWRKSSDEVFEIKFMDGIVHEKSIDSIKGSFSDKKVAKELLSSFGGRSADMAKMPDNFLPKTHAETYLYEDKVTLLNWDKEIAVIIKDKDIFQLVKEMFNSTKYLMERYDQNEKIAKKLVDLGA